MTAAGDSVPDLSAFQLEVARLFFARLTVEASCWQAEQPCSRST